MKDFRLLRKNYPLLACAMDTFIASKRIPHAIVLQGPESVGKKTVCRAWAHQLLGGFDCFDTMMNVLCEDHSLCHHIAQGTHPEMMLLSPPVQIHDIRTIIHKLSQTSWSGTQRIVVIPRIDDMNSSCTNALLKVVETPPPRTLFLMTASGSVAKTLLSRCLQMSMMPLTSIHNLDESSRDTIYDNPLFMDMVQGCVGRAQTLKPIFEWVQEGWDFMNTNAQTPSVPSKQWIEWASENMSWWKRIVYLWAYKATHRAYHAQKMMQWDVVWSSCRAIIDAHFTFRTHPALTVMTVCEKMGLFFRTHQTKLCHVTSQPPYIMSTTTPT